MEGRLGQDAPLRHVRGAAVSVRPSGIILKLECGHDRFLGGPTRYTPSEWQRFKYKCMDCQPIVYHY